MSRNISISTFVCPRFAEIDSPSPINSSGKRDLREVKSMKNSPLYRDSINVLLRHPFIVIPRVMVHVLCLREYLSFSKQENPVFMKIHKGTVFRHPPVITSPIVLFFIIIFNVGIPFRIIRGNTRKLILLSVA